MIRFVSPQMSKGVYKCLVMLAAAVLLSGCAGVYGNYFAPTAAIVNTTKIPEIEISRSLNQTLASDPEFAPLLRGAKGDENRIAAQRNILTRLIQDEVMRQESGKVGVSVNDDEVADRIAQIKAQFPNEAEFLTQLDRLNFTLPQLLRLIENQILLEKLQSAVTEEVKVTDEQIQQAYNETKADYDDQVKAAHIQICADINPITNVCSATPDDEAKAKDIANRARSGEDFAGLAREHSVDQTTSQSGGEIGWISPTNQAPTQFEQVVFTLQVGQISDPVPSGRGWHVIKVLARGRPFEEARDTIEEQLLEEPKRQAFQEWLEAALRRATIRVNSKFGRFDATSLQIVPIAQPQNA